MDLMVALENDKTWTTKEGKTIKIEDLEDRHLLNIINMITVRAKQIEDIMVLEINRYGELIATDELELILQRPLMKALLKEAKKRKVI